MRRWQRSAYHSPSSWSAVSEMGTSRSLLPLPMMRTNRSSAYIADSFMLTSSLTRSPQEKSTSMMALLRCPSAVLMSMLAFILSTSSGVSTSGSRSPVCGDSSSSVGSLSMRPSTSMNL